MLIAMRNGETAFAGFGKISDKADKAPDADTLDRSRYPELRRIADHFPQKDDSEEAVLYLYGGE